MSSWSKKEKERLRGRLRRTVEAQSESIAQEQGQAENLSRTSLNNDNPVLSNTHSSETSTSSLRQERFLNESDEQGTSTSTAQSNEESSHSKPIETTPKSTKRTIARHNVRSKQGRFVQEDTSVTRFDIAPNSGMPVASDPDALCTSTSSNAPELTLTSSMGDSVPQGRCLMSFTLPSTSSTTPTMNQLDETADSASTSITHELQGRFMTPIVPHFFNSGFADSGLGPESDEEPINEIATHGRALMDTDAEDNEMPVTGPIINAIVPKRRPGRPAKQCELMDVPTCPRPNAPHKPNSMPLIAETPKCRGASGYYNPRRIQLREREISKIDDHIQKVIADYTNRPWPKKKSALPARASRRLWTRCGRGGCECKSFAQCQQNAVAYSAAAKYDKQHEPEKVKTTQKLAPVTTKCHTTHICAAKDTHHKVEYFDSGQFGDENCAHCGAVMLKREHEAVKQGRRAAPCCSNGDCHTELMKREYDELQNPPKLLKELVDSKDDDLREQFLDNTMTLNNTFAFASIHSDKAPADQMAGRMDTVKYNGEFSFQFSDLMPPQDATGQRLRPTFAQVYTLMPEDATKLREENISNILNRHIQREILAKLEELMRQNPFGQTFMTAGAKVEQAKQRNNGEIPRFQIVLLTDREAKTDLLKNRTDCTIIERTEAPTAQQVAVIWVNEDGLAPQINGFWVCDKAGKMRELKSGMPQLDPCCFPLLHPRGTAGYRWYIKKKKYESKQGRLTEEEMEQMERQFDAARDAELDQAEVGDAITPPNDEMRDDEIEFGEEIDENARQGHEMQEEENELDKEDDDPMADGADQVEQDEDEVVAPHDSVVEPQFGWQGRKKRVLGVKKKGPQENISERRFYCYRIATRNNDKNAFHWLWFALRLAEYFVIAVLNRIERNEMDHQMAVQERKNLRQTLARDYIKVLESGIHRLHGPNAKLGRVFRMPQSFAGSRQYYQQKYAELMTIVRHLGKPTWFVTFTGNPNWPEITEALQGRQSYTHRCEIVCRIFMDKAAEFIKDLIQRNVLGKAAGWCYSVEHQKRGMPHIHFLLILKKEGRITTPEEVDQFVSARIPALPPMTEQTPEANQQRRLWYYVTTLMLHSCNDACLDHDEQGQRICKKHFPKPFSNQTELSEVRYTNYVRLRADFELPAGAPREQQTLPDNDHLLPENDPERDFNEIRYQRIPADPNLQRDYETIGLYHLQTKGRQTVAKFFDDSSVIPYNPYLLLKYGCHINIEYVFGQKACKYIFKYLLKGFEKAYVRVTPLRRGATTEGQEEVYDYDEISATFKVRYMTAMEAYMRLHSYRIVRLSHQIYALSVHDEGGQTIVVEEGHEEQGRVAAREDTRLMAFFKLCATDPDAAELRYDQVPYRYTWNQMQRCWWPRKNKLTEDPESAKMFVRIYTVSAKRPELFAIRALLLNRKGPKSFEDLRTVDGKTFDTFAGAAAHLRLLESDDMFADAMRDACDEHMSLTRLQHYFAMMLVHGQPSDPQKLFDTFLDEMRPHRAGRDPDDVQRSREFRRGEVMLNLEYYFNCMDTSCSQIGLHGLPANYNFSRQEEALGEANLFDDFFGGSDRRKSPRQVVLEHIHRLNVDQRVAFERIAEAVNGRGDNRCFFIEGAGGCGKTFLYNTLIRWCLAGKPSLVDDDQQGRNLNSGSVISAASTGIAALLLIGGGTVHRQFCVPNDVDDNTIPRIAYETEKGRRLRAAELIIIDEISMLSKTVLRYLDRQLRDLCASDKPFGGKTIVLGGDWKQLTPVVEEGDRHAQLQESIKMEPIFQETFKKISLTINMRTAPSQQSLRDWLHIIGNGLHQAGANATIQSNDLQIPDELAVKQLDEIVNFCYPQSFFADPSRNVDCITDSAILCPTNADVAAINNATMDRMVGDARIYDSIDQPLEKEELYDTFRADFNIEAIHNETPMGMPPHRLILKAGAPVMLIRNLDVTQGLCNGARMQIKHMTDENIFCRLLTGPRAGQEFAIPRVKFEYGNSRHHRGLSFRRIQFPIKPCFAMTVNKAQGQTLKRMGLVLSGRQCFSHGQVYVAFSRVTTMDGIRVYSPHTRRGEQTFIKNVVFPELLDISQRSVVPASVTAHNSGLAENEDTEEVEIDLPC